MPSTRRGELQPAQQVRHFIRGQVDAQQALHIGRGHRHLGILRREGVIIHQAFGHLAAAPFQHAQQAQGHTPAGHLRVDAAAEAVAGLGGQLLGHHRAADVDEIPGRAFQQDVLRLRAHLGLGPAHHPGDGERPGRVAHQHGVLIQAALDAVQGGELLARGRRCG